MKTVICIILVTAVVVGAMSLGQASAADPPAVKLGPLLQFELVDGTVITGRIDAKTITIRIWSDNTLRIPVANVRELTVGLNDRPVFVQRVEALIKSLDSDNTRQAAQRELIALGPAITPIVELNVTGVVSARRLAIEQIQKTHKTWSTDHPDAPEAMVRPLELRSKVRTGHNTFLGTIIVGQFKIASPFGNVVVKLGDIHLIRPAARAAPGKLLSRWDVELRDGTHARGIPTGQPLRVQTRYGTMVVPLAQIQQAAFTADGKTVRVRCGNSDRIAGTLKPKTTISLKTEKGVTNLPAGKIAMMSLGTPASRGPLVFKGHTGGVYAMAFAPDGRRIASGDHDRTIRLWDSATGEELFAIKGHKGEVRSIAFSPDGKRLASTSADEIIKLWDAATGRELLAFKCPSKGSSSVVFSPDGKFLATGVWARDRNTVKLWDAATGKELRVFQGHVTNVFCVVFSPDGSRLVSGGAKGTIEIWDTVTGKQLIRIDGRLQDMVSSVAFSPDGKRLVSGHYDKTVRIWDAGTGKGLLTLKGHTAEVFCVAFSPDGKYVASGSNDHIIKLWNSTTGAQLLTLNKHSGYVSDIAFSPDGKRLVSSSNDKTVKIWDVSDWTEAAK